MRLILRWIAGGLLSVLIVGAASAQDAGTRLLVLHPIRATVEIPADWVYQPESGSYGGDSGYVYGDTVSTDTLGAACDSVEHAVQAQIAVERQPITLDGLAGCELRELAPDPNNGLLGVAVVLQNDALVIFDGSTGLPTSYVSLFVDADHAEAVLASLSFDPARASASAYMDSLIDWMQAYSYFGDEIDWQALRSEVAAGAAPMTDLKGVPSLIVEVVQALQAVGDRHSSYNAPTEIAQDFGFASGAQTPAPATINNVNGKAISDQVGYVELRSSFGTTAENYVRAAYSIVAAEEAESPKACWVIDLRGNHGGNMLVMMLSVESILGDGIVGGFETADGTRSFFGLRDQTVYYDGAPASTAYRLPSDLDPVTLAHPHPPVAVLQSGSSVSAAESTLLAFRGRPDTRSFGDPSVGLTLGNAVLMLFDGSGIALATGASMDRNGNVFTGSIPPDVEVPTSYRSLNPLPLSMDGALQAALDWLREDYGCE